MESRIGAAEPREATSRALYQIGAVGGLAAVAFALGQITIEVIGVGFAGTPVPTTVEGWFGLLRSNRLLGLTELTGLQIPMFALLVPLFLALHAGLKSTNAAVSLVATAFGLLGIGVYLASNTAFSMLSLSDEWAAATSNAERVTLLAAGQAMLAQYDGPGLDAGVFLVMVATLGISWLMLRSPAFGRPAAALGIVAGVTGLTYYLAVSLPSTRIFLLEAAGTFFVLWIALASRGLVRVDAASLQPSAASAGSTTAGSWRPGR